MPEDGRGGGGLAAGGGGAASPKVTPVLFDATGPPNSLTGTTAPPAGNDTPLYSALIHGEMYNGVVYEHLQYGL